MSLTTTQSHVSIASALTAEQMRAVARASRIDNTVAVAAFPATATPDVWPGEPVGEPFTIMGKPCPACGRLQPEQDFMPAWGDGRLADICLECWITGRSR